MDFTVSGGKLCKTNKKYNSCKLIKIETTEIPTALDISELDPVTL